MIKFSRETYDDVVHHAYEGGDEEVCGVLAGEYGEQHTRVTNAHRAENVAETPQIRYAIDPEEQLGIIDRIEGEESADVVGFYHSHPTGATEPSETDLQRATWPERSYVICALDGYPFVGSWRFRDGRDTFERETVAVR